MKNTKKGFTLVELLVVIAILAILSTVAVVGYTSFIDNAKEQKVETELAQVKTSVLADDITNEDYDLTDGEVSAADATALNTFLDDLKTNNALTGTFSTVQENATTITYTLDGKVATWTLKTGDIAVTDAQ